MESFPVFPASTQPNVVSNATGDQLVLSAGLAVTPQVGGLSRIGAHFESNGVVGCTDKSQVTLGTTTAVTGIFSFGESVGEIYRKWRLSAVGSCEIFPLLQ